MLRSSHKSLYHAQKEKILHTAKSFYKKSNTTKIISILGASCIIGIFFFWALFLRGVPSLEGLENGDYFRESTVIYDSEGHEIYSIFKDGKRTYVPYENISQSVKDAIVSVEDQSFFENPGIDFLGLMRVAATHLTGGRFGRVGGASTISQQLIKNTLLTNEVSIKRKVQEAYLSYKMNNAYTKEKILEMYLNAIPFGYNANGIEQASRTFFGKSASEVGPLGATILASLPNGPTKFSPYLHRDKLMGKIEVYPISDETSRKELLTPEDKQKYKGLYDTFRNYIKNLEIERTSNGVTICGVKEEYIKDSTFSPDRNGCIETSPDGALKFFANIVITQNITTDDGSEQYALEYTIGRKDFVASRMLEDRKIDGPTFQKIVFDGLEFEFKKYAESIKYPYFVMYVKEYLENKYGKDLDITSGLRVYTTINPKLQDKAEDLVKKQVPLNKSKGATSAALVSMDNTDGKLLAMVGGADYFDTENGGNNNMATALRQPGSSFKPFVYALAISKNPIGPETPIADVQTKFGSWGEPDNYDRSFKGIMMVKNALDYSRNIPAIKMYYLAGQEDAVVKFGRSVGLTTLKENANYGAPMAIGTAEVRPIDLMQGYSVLANQGIKRDVYFISKITDNEGNVIEEHKTPEKEESIFSAGASYIVSKILADNSARPDSSFWRNALTIAGRTVAAKTGTSNKPAKKGSNTILPGDLWTVGYTPQITTVVWAGNVDGTPTKGSCDGLNCAAPIWKGFMEYALKDLPKEEFKKPKDIYTYNIVKTSGKLATKDTPEGQTVSTIMAVKFDEYDEGQKEIQVDTLCNGPVSENTPPEAIATIYIPSSKPVIDGYDPAWTSGFFDAIHKQGSGSLVDGTSLEMSETPCERPKDAGNVKLSGEFVGVDTASTKKTLSVNFDGDRKIKTLRIRYDGEVVREIEYGSGAKTSGSERVAIELHSGDTPIILEAIDIYGFQYNGTKDTLVSSPSGNNTTTPLDKNIQPTITLQNPKGSSISLYVGDSFNLRFRVAVGTTNREIQVTLDGKTLQTANSGESFVFPISSDGLTSGTHKVQVNLTDGNFKTTNASFTLNILPR